MFSGANTVAVIMLALSGSARSNGALNAGYFCFQALLQAYDATVQKKRPLVCSTSVIIMSNSIWHEETKWHTILHELCFVSIRSNQQKHVCLITSLCLTSWQFRPLWLELCAPFSYFYLSLLSKHMDIWTYVYMGAQTNWGHGAKQKFPYCMASSKATTGKCFYMKIVRIRIGMIMCQN